MNDWYTITYPDGSTLGVLTRDEAVRISNSDGAVYGVSSVITGPFDAPEPESDFIYYP